MNHVGGAILSVVRQDWLQTSTGVNVVAVELFAIMFSVILFAVQDSWISLADKLYVVHGLRVFGICFGQTMAAVFSASAGFIERPGCLER